MPYLRMRIAAANAEGKTALVAEALTNNVISVLKKQREVIAIDLQFTSPSQWYIGGKRLEDGKNSFFLEIKITEGTNTRDEKDQFIKAVFKDIERIIGNIDDASYIVLQDVASDSWGFGGKTQEYRYIRGK